MSDRLEIREERLRDMRNNDPEWAAKWWRVYEQWKRDVLAEEDCYPSGYVYFVQGGRGPIKIGYTRHEDVARRVAQLQTGSAYKLRVLGIIRASARDEQKLHEMFAHWRMEGEWFRPGAYGLKQLIDELNTRLPV